tara:strand:- start:502 stop:702 length:201 start_codon:yes stop_codon:yes gene_type:complete
MEPLSVISLFFNLATYNSKNELKQYDQSHYYYSVADAKQQIFNGRVNNLNLKNFEKLTNFNISLEK